MKDRFLSITTHNGMLGVNVWADEAQQGDLLKQSRFRLRDVSGMLISDKSGERQAHWERPVTLIIFLPGGTATFEADDTVQVYEDFNLALDQWEATT